MAGGGWGREESGEVGEGKYPFSRAWVFQGARGAGRLVWRAAALGRGRWQGGAEAMVVLWLRKLKAVTVVIY